MGRTVPQDDSSTRGGSVAVERRRRSGVSGDFPARRGQGTGRPREEER
jgi:hypothetical protein